VIDHIMGHAKHDMASVYRQQSFDQQLRKCAEHVRVLLLLELEWPAVWVSIIPSGGSNHDENSQALLSRAEGTSCSAAFGGQGGRE
jgi:hypothetical protein